MGKKFVKHFQKVFLKASCGNRMKRNVKMEFDLKRMNKILKEKKIKISEIPDDLDIENLPGDVEIILDEDFPDLEDDFWEEDE